MPGFVENVNTVATTMTLEFRESVSTIAADLANIDTVATNINDVNAVATDIVNINTVANDTTNVDIVATNILDVNTTAINITDINSVVSQVIPNLPEILLADDNALIATIKAAEASVSATNALVSANAAADLLDQFDDRYLGTKTADPLVDNDGNTLLVGAVYFNTVLTPPRIRVWDGLVWSDAVTVFPDTIATLTNKVIDDIRNTVGADHVHYKVRNASGATIPINTVVTASGTQPGTDYIQVVPVTDPQTQIALGLAHTELLNNGTGLVVNTGVHDNMNTSAWAVGTILYPSTTGGLTSTKPTSGQYQACAVVLRSHATKGTLLIEFTEPKYIASTTQIGYVQLNNTLTSTSITQALTAAQGKALNDRLVTVENGKQPLDATLTALAALVTSADKLIYATGVDTFSQTTLSSFARTLIDDVDDATARATLGISATNTPFTASGNISATNVQSALQELDAEKMQSSEYLMTIGNINSPLLDMPLKNSLAMKVGVGSATFTRASTATYIDRYGVLKTAAVDEPRFEKEGYLNEGSSTNLLTYSEQFDNASWVKTASTISANTTNTLDPYGTNLADILIEDTTTAVHATYRSYEVASATITFSCFVKASGCNTGRLSSYESATPKNPIIVDFDLVAKTAVPSSASTTSASILELSNGWFRISGTTTSAALVSTTFSVQSTRLGTGAYLGNGTSGLYIFGAQLEALPFATSYIPTTSATVTRSAPSNSFTFLNNIPSVKDTWSISIDVVPLQMLTANAYVLGGYTDTNNYIMFGAISGERFFIEIKNLGVTHLALSDTAQKYTVGTKYRLTATYNKGLISLYMNGVLVKQTSNTEFATNPVLPSNVYIGAHLSNSGYLQSYISNLRIWDKALTAQEVALA